MDSPWRRTLASVFLLLSPHNVRVLCQNVLQNGPLPQLPLLREPMIDAGIIPGSQRNFQPGPNGFPTEYVPPEFRFIPEYNGPACPQGLPYGSGVPINIGPQGPVFNLPQLNNIPALQGPVYNLPPINVPPLQGQPLNIQQNPQFPLCALPGNIQSTPNIPLIPPTNISPISLVPQGPNCDIPFNNNLFPLGLQPPNIPSVPITQGQILPGPQVPLAPIGVPLNLPPIAKLPNQNMPGFPFSPPPLPQPYLPPGNIPCTLPTDLPISIPVQNYSPIIQTPIQPLYPPSIVPGDCLPNTAFLPNYQCPILPPVYPNKPQLPLYPDYVDQPAVEDYTPVPINLNVNVPSPTIPEPKIIVITAYPPAPTPTAVVTTPDSSDVSDVLYPPFPLPPIIIEGRRSRSRSWLPLFLVALFARDGNYGGYGDSGACCCSCDSGPIPVPYPIPIPTNNHIILGNTSRSRKRNNTRTNS